MSSYREKSDWGCLAWFLLAFAIIAVVLCLIVLASTPSGGGGSPCQSLANNDRLDMGNSTKPVKLVGDNGGVTYVSYPVQLDGRVGGKPTPKPSKSSKGRPKIDIDCD